MQTKSPLVISYLCPLAEAELSLKSIVQPMVKGAYAALAVEVVLTIQPDQTITIIDDLLSIGIYQSSIRLIVQKNGTVFYKNLLAHVVDLAEPAYLLLRKNCTVQLVEQGAHAEVLFHCSSKNNDQFLIMTEQEHLSEKTSSSVVIKSVVDDASKVRSNTLIKVEKNAHQVKATQTSKNIMLSKSARAIAIPKLEVLANDVSCTHGAAMSTIDPETLFYLQTRGISLVESKKIIIAAFLGEVIS
jgi:Fe-S cluster assembly scaffold protein SufB